MSTKTEAGLVVTTSFADAMKDSVGRKEFYTVEDVMITPEDARDILALRRLPRERFLTERTVDKYKRDMETGKFYGALHTIKFGRNDHTLPEDQFINELADGEPIEYDGQHRLRAIVLTGMPQVMNVMFNVPPEAHGNIDDNRSRKLADQLRFRGEDNAPALERLITRAYAWEQGKRTYSGHVQPTVQESERFVRDDPSLRDAVTVAATFKSDKLATPTALRCWSSSPTCTRARTWTRAILSWSCVTACGRSSTPRSLSSAGRTTRSTWASRPGTTA
jgi:hypothetical protein